MRTRNIVVSGVALGAMAVGGGVVLASQDGSSVPAQLRLSAATPKTLTVLGRARGASDALPASERALLAPEIGRNRLDPDRTRAVGRGARGRAIYLLQGNDQVCLAVPDPVDGSGVTCQTVAAARDGRLWNASVAATSTDVSLTALVPDGVADVNVLSRDGSSNTVKVVDNTVTTVLHGGATLSYVAPDGSHTLTIPGPPPVG